MEYDANWQTRYRDMIETPKKAVAHVRSGHRVFVGTGCGEPTVLVEAMTKEAVNLADVEIVQLLTKGRRPVHRQPLRRVLQGQLLLHRP